MTATLVEDRSGRSPVRRRINVPTYPLAESIAYGWWRLTSPSSTEHGGFRLADAADGYPWPDLTLVTGRGYVLAQLRPVERAVESIRFLAGTELLLAPAPVERELRLFVENTIQQLEDAGVTGTPLQEEWAAIASADAEVEAFCRTASALGLDPYALDESETSLVVSLGSAKADPDLIAELAASTTLPEVEAAREWLQEAVERTESVADPPALTLPFEPLPVGRWERPWRVGYERARKVRESLQLSPADRLPVEELVDIDSTKSPAPSGVAGLAQSRGNGIAVATPGRFLPQAQRFAGARAIGRRTFDDSRHGVILTARYDYAAKVERAFAAELLAPATGIDQFLGESTSDESLFAAAKTFDVSIQVIQHQLDNQLGRRGL
ncbi:hypothetical protein [Intrasporangium sp.]|uniref:hypothetical protein n=1 Tax=Intrasporangium sp. TaxID=1925024 RepID=UPI0032218330